MAFGSSKSKSKSPSPLDPQQQAALAAELVASELLMRQMLGGGSMQRNTKYLMEEQERSAFVPSLPSDMNHRSRKSKTSAHSSLPLPPMTHVIPSSVMPPMPSGAIYDNYDHHRQYGPHYHGHLRSEPRRRHPSDSSSSSSSSLTPSPTSSTFDANEASSYMTYPASSDHQYIANFGTGHQSTVKATKGMSLKERAKALFHGH
ncbi:hypothetical protein C8R41DRAFT_981018 [Lentinula lateritia]|uniref:Uncharacterized protein n=1 Tax=Lentinula lateritia TaxID=40482 RepID=A0ABQ8VGX2_9AGAR|nr:hypothetical protein C8R41DRAFT_981018 [Lentinula lateritia]